MSDVPPQLHQFHQLLIFVKLIYFETFIFLYNKKEVIDTPVIIHEDFELQK